MTNHENKRLENLEAQVAEIQSDIKHILQWVNKRDGGTKVAMWTFGALATVIGSSFAVLRLFGL